VGDRINVAWHGLVEAVDQRHAGGERLARPGWRLDEDVLTSEDVPDTYGAPMDTGTVGHD
jgi:hypothetical protein